VSTEVVNANQLWTQAPMNGPLIVLASITAGGTHTNMWLIDQLNTAKTGLGRAHRARQDFIHMHRFVSLGSPDPEKQNSISKELQRPELIQSSYHCLTRTQGGYLSNSWCVRWRCILLRERCIKIMPSLWLIRHQLTTLPILRTLLPLELPLIFLLPSCARTRVGFVTE
jgi:hypothetical protein